jgi:hypothetical protein
MADLEKLKEWLDFAATKKMEAYIIKTKWEVRVLHHMRAADVEKAKLASDAFDQAQEEYAQIAAQLIEALQNLRVN